MFKNFLKSEFSEENIEFWIACEEFKTTRTNKLTTRAQKIYGDFVAINAPKQVNFEIPDNFMYKCMTSQKTILNPVNIFVM